MSKNIIENIIVTLWHANQTDSLIYWLQYMDTLYKPVASLSKRQIKDIFKLLSFESFQICQIWFVASIKWIFADYGQK